MVPRAVSSAHMQRHSNGAFLGLDLLLVLMGLFIGQAAKSRGLLNEETTLLAGDSIYVLGCPILIAFCFASMVDWLIFYGRMHDASYYW